MFYNDGVSANAVRIYEGDELALGRWVWGGAVVSAFIPASRCLRGIHFMSRQLLDIFHQAQGETWRNYI